MTVMMVVFSFLFTSSRSLFVCFSYDLQSESRDDLPFLFYVVMVDLTIWTLHSMDVYTNEIFQQSQKKI